MDMEKETNLAVNKFKTIRAEKTKMDEIFQQRVNIIMFWIYWVLRLRLYPITNISLMLGPMSLSNSNQRIRSYFFCNVWGII